MATEGKAIQADAGLPEKVPFWLDPKKRAVMYQIGVLCMFGLLGWAVYTAVASTRKTPKRAKPTTHKPMMLPPVKETLSAGANPF